MFSKSSSSTSTRTDTPLRKSDVRSLLASLTQSYFPPPSPESEVYNAHDALLSRIFNHSNFLITRRKISKDFSVIFIKPKTSISPDLAKDDTMPFTSQNITYPLLLEQTTSSSSSSSSKNNNNVTLIPLLSLLKAFPNMLPRVLTYAPVTRNLCRGADLMKSGIHSFEQHTYKNPNPSSYTTTTTTNLLKEDTIVAMKITTNPQPFSVGLLTWTVSGTVVDCGVGFKGVGVSVLHCFGDDLWRRQMIGAGAASGGDGMEGRFGNVGFLSGGGGVRGISDGVNGDAGGDDEEEEEEEEEEEADNVGSDESFVIVKNNGSVSNSNSDDSDNDGVILTTPSTLPPPPPPLPHLESLLLSLNPIQPTPDPTPPPYLDFSQPDDVLKYAFYKSLSTLPTSSLPIKIASYYSSHLLQNKPKGHDVDLKRTSWKKIGLFVKEMERSGVVFVRREGKEIVEIVRVDKSEFGFREFKRLVLAKEKEKEMETGDANVNEGGGGENESTLKGSESKKLKIVTLCLIPPNITKALNLPLAAVSASTAKSEERRGTGFLTLSEARDILNAYIDREDLSEGGNVVVNGGLCDALLKMTKKEKQHTNTNVHDQQQPTVYPEVMTKKETFEKYTDKLDPAYAVVQMPNSLILTLKRGTPPSITIEVECKQQKKKFVTRVRGLEFYSVNPVSFAKDVAVRFACAAGIDANCMNREALKKDCVEVVIQGRIEGEICALLSGNEKLSGSGHGGVKGGGYFLPEAVFKVKLGKGCEGKKKR